MFLCCFFLFFVYFFYLNFLGALLCPYAKAIFQQHRKSYKNCSTSYCRFSSRKINRIKNLKPNFELCLFWWKQSAITVVRVFLQSGKASTLDNEKEWVVSGLNWILHPAQGGHRFADNFPWAKIFPWSRVSKRTLEWWQYWGGALLPTKVQWSPILFKVVQPIFVSRDIAREQNGKRLLFRETSLETPEKADIMYSD